VSEAERQKTKQSDSAAGGAASAGAATGRRRVLARAPVAAMAAALLASYGTLLAFMARFLFPADKRRVDWMYVATVGGFAPGTTLLYKTPAGETVNVTRRGSTGTAEDFAALSSTCPHLGCQVHWEPQNNRYFCPCHNGAFRPDGKAYEGPPAEAGQSLPQYPLKVEAGLLYIEVPLEGLAIHDVAAEPRGARGSVIDLAGVRRGPGHDPCLAAGPRGAGREA